MKSVHLVCNAHLDPVWLWEWEEGAAEAMGTFRTAADLCEEFDGFVFNHNEAILYQWVEEYEPALFRRIQKLVKAGKWHIMGGWHVQPDCNMPSGESFVRQILLGRQYFQEKFGARPTVAINFDPFGHTRGLAQILARSGYGAYLFCRPGQNDCPLPDDQFVWEGYDGSKVLATRVSSFYNSRLGKAREKIERVLPSCRGDRPGIILWGVGDHGGGPSRADLRQLADLIRKTRDAKLRHSTPEACFRELKRRAASLPVHRGDLNAWAVGCYTSQVRIKQRHRLLENELFATEKMASAAWAQRRMAYPRDELREATRDLATGEFHDILPGSSIQPAEAAALRMLDHGLEIISRAKARAFFALAGGQPRAKRGEIPVLVYNPHPFPVKAVVECEFQLADHNWEGTFTGVTARRGGRALPTQVEKELSNIPIDWRKRAVFAAELAPAQMNRFDCRLKALPRRPRPKLRARNGKIRFRTAELDVRVNTRTGLLDRYRVKGADCLARNACRPLVILDSEDPWGMQVRRFRKKGGAFKMLSARESALFSGVKQHSLPAVRVIEDGPVRAVVEALFGYGSSRMCLRYKLPRRGTEIELEVRAHWNEKDRMLKLSLPTRDRDSVVRGQVAYGADDLPANGDEIVAQKWLAVLSKRSGRALTVINNGTYGADFRGGELRLSLLRSPGYSAHPIGDRETLAQDRYSPRIDQGERTFRFWINGGSVGKRLAAVDREALARNEKPMALSFFPSGGGAKPRPFVTLSDGVVQLTAAKKAEKGNALILRLFEPTGRRRETVVSLPFAGLRKRISLGGFEIRTYRVDLAKRKWTEVDLTESARSR